MVSSVATTGSSYNTRNMKIAHAILKGEKAVVVAKRYGMSAQSCMEILRRYCWRLDPLLYESLQIGYQDVSLQMLREHADTFFDLEKADHTVTMDSPIWKVKEFNTAIVKTLVYSKIYTLHELSLIEVNDLKKIPMIGAKSLEIILKVLKMRG